MPLRFFINDVILIAIRHRRTCRRAYVLKALSSAHLCDPPETGLSEETTGLSKGITRLKVVKMSRRGKCAEDIMWMMKQQEK